MAMDYAGIAVDYDKFRPGYPASLIRGIQQYTHLTSSSKILEIGCGPGTATKSFAPIGCQIHCLEPVPDLCKLAETKLQSQSNITIENVSFEEWELKDNKYDFILAASSYHLIERSYKYYKVADALCEDGYLVLLWNMEVRPSLPVFKCLLEVYKKHNLYTPSFIKRKDQKTILTKFHYNTWEWGHYFANPNPFDGLRFENATVRFTYQADDYIKLLSTYAQYAELDPEPRDALLQDIRNKIIDEFEGMVEVSYVSGSFITRKSNYWEYNNWYY
jgi:SAM-dependent methyltransferase